MTLSLLSTSHWEVESTLLVSLSNNSRQETHALTVQVHTSQTFTEEIAKTGTKGRPLSIRRTYQQDEPRTITEPSDPEQEDLEEPSLKGHTVIFIDGKKGSVATFQSAAPQILQPRLSGMVSLVDTYATALPKRPVRMNEPWTVDFKRLQGWVRRLPIPLLEKNMSALRLTATFRVEYAIDIAFTEKDPNEGEGLSTKGTASLTLFVQESDTLEINLTTKRLVSHHSTSLHDWSTLTLMEEPSPMTINVKGRGPTHQTILFTYPSNRRH
jgi:hypothetical protein